MKKLMKIVLLFPLFLIMTMTLVQAEENENTETTDIILTYKMEGIVFHQLHITVSGPGIVKDGDAVIREGTNTYEMREEAEKVLELVPDQRSHIKSIKINGNEQNNNLKSITIKELKDETEVNVQFEEDEEKPKDPIEPVKPEDPHNGQNKPNGNQNTPNEGWNGIRPGTGDVTRISILIFLMLLSLGTMIYMKSKKETTAKSEGEK